MNEKIYSASAGLGRGLIYAFMRTAYRPKVIYASRLGRMEMSNEPVIFIANHVGHNDGQMMYMLMDNATLFMAKDQMEKPVVRWVTTGAGFLPVDRFGMDITWVRAALEEMKNGRNVIIFPEGETEKTGCVLEFKPGFAMLAVMAKAKVVPVYIDGEYNKFFGKRLRVYVGDPIELTEEGRGLSADYLKSEAAKFQKIFEDRAERPGFF